MKPSTVTMIYCLSFISNLTRASSFIVTASTRATKQYICSKATRPFYSSSLILSSSSSSLLFFDLSPTTSSSSNSGTRLLQLSPPPPLSRAPLYRSILPSSPKLGHALGRVGRSSSTTRLFSSDDGESARRQQQHSAAASSSSSPRLTLSVTTSDDMEDVGSVLSIGADAGSVILLDGDLGAGKTCFARGFVRAKTGNFDMRVTSPTYLLSNSYPTEEGVLIHHMDLYRLSGSPKDLEPLNLPFVFSDCISLIEWPSRLQTVIPQTRLEINMTINEGTGERLLKLVPFGNKWEERVQYLEEEGYLDDLIVSS